MNKKYDNLLNKIEGKNSRRETINRVKRTVMDSIMKRKEVTSNKVAKFSYKRSTYLIELDIEKKLDTLALNMKKKVIDDEDFFISKGFKSSFVNEAIHQLLEKYEDEYGEIREIDSYYRYNKVELFLYNNESSYEIESVDLLSGEVKYSKKYSKEDYNSAFNDFNKQDDVLVKEGYYREERKPEYIKYSIKKED